MSRPKDINAPSPWNMRIWDVENNEWLGQSDPDGATFYGFDIRGGETTVFSNMNWLYNQFAHGRELIWERSTGFKDRKGEEIYEGDIIKDTSDGDCLINSVFWCEKGGFWGVKPRSPFADRGWGWFIVRDDIEVVGNIHENPELLSNDLMEK